MNLPDLVRRRLADFPETDTRGFPLDVENYSEPEEVCNTENVEGWTCTEPPDHKGPHIARFGDGTACCPAWKREDT